MKWQLQRNADYLRFSFHAPVGPLAVDHYYHINIDADGNPGTGRAFAGIGVEVMIENGSGYQQKNGGFNEGTVGMLGLESAPAGQAGEFECRISRKATSAAARRPCPRRFLAMGLRPD